MIQNTLARGGGYLLHLITYSSKGRFGSVTSEVSRVLVCGASRPKLRVNLADASIHSTNVISLAMMGGEYMYTHKRYIHKRLIYTNIYIYTHIYCIYIYIHTVHRHRYNNLIQFAFIGGFNGTIIYKWAIFHGYVK